MSEAEARETPREAPRSSPAWRGSAGVPARALRGARHGLGALWTTLRSGFGQLRRTWRRSLQFRTVAVTMILGTVVLAIVGSYLYQRVADGLVEDRRVTASAEAALLTSRVQQQFDISDKVLTSDALLESATSIVQGVAGTERSRYVLLARGSNNTDQSYALPLIQSGEVNLSAVPDALRQKVADNPTVQQMQVVSVKLAGEGDPVPSWVIGQQVAVPLANNCGLYFVYPMTRERDTLSLVGRFLLLGGLLLMLLLGGIAYVVTRLVVAPVRRAAEVATRLAAGDLDERMAAKGEDDLATLATSFNEMAASLQQQIGQLENLSRFQQRFVSDVSHELRTPLTTIRMAGDLIHDSRADFDPAVSRSAELLHNELDRFEALLSDLLEISRYDAGAAVLDIEPTDVRSCVERVVAASTSLAERKGSQVLVQMPDSACIADLDSRRVERILRNLLVNAIEHGESLPITISVARDEQAVAVSVRDNGIGLRLGEAGMVFNRFWRADPARARTTGGTGLGLAISLEDARLHHGWLQAWGMPGQGSCFRLTLPRAAGEALESSPLPLNPTLADVAAEVTANAAARRAGSTGTAMPNGGAGPLVATPVAGDTDEARETATGVSPDAPSAATPVGRP